MPGLEISNVFRKKDNDKWHNMAVQQKSDLNGKGEYYLQPGFDWIVLWDFR